MKTRTKRLSLALALTGVLAASVAGLARAADDNLLVFDWAGYEDPSFHPKYAGKYGDSPSFAFFGEEEEAFQKLRSGFKADLGHPCSQNVVKWREAGLLQPLDTSRIEGWSDLNPDIMAMKDLVTSDDGKVWLMPYEWGNTQLTYNSDKIDEKDVQSVRAFADPKFEGRVSIGDNVDDAYALAAIAIGLRNGAVMNDEQFRQASDFLRQVHKNVRLYWADTTEIVQALTGGEVDLAWAWNDAVAQSVANGVPIKARKDTDEGYSTWVCGYVMFKDAPGNKDKAYDFLSALNDPEVAKTLVGDWGYGHANAKGMAGVDPQVLKEQGYETAQESSDRIWFQSPVPSDLKQKMIAEFEKIKAGY
ncbi:putative spermidine/putrescine transport system substrate-binding protein [Pseudaminobacter salicylatoxidans]|uniref:Putative spermidine/putrescine transport system substrate-binding protein n=1 Tax=Pseudaminobacter salicylatoxidans TaxID=93369 RepID=A0A316C5D0_PSESE|nr:extracellular solute-binding protein [Pseudaminobacter salicylatoxidans]PWJ84901.1 putative spermidine/putrescine transport system substrate-binding protein [Pseudaminobacter salicylatoxidans]